MHTRLLSVAGITACVAALPTWEVSLQLRALPADTASASSTTLHVPDATAALSHVYAHILGLPSPFLSSPPLPSLPTTPLFTRPTSSAFYVLERGLGDDASLSLPFQTILLAENSGLRPASLAHVAALHKGVAARSVEVALSRGVAREDDGILLATWSDATGFNGHTTTLTTSMPWSGVPACNVEGVAVLTTALGATLSHVETGREHCATVSVNGVHLNAAETPVAHALSEVIAIVMVARETVAAQRVPDSKPAPGLLLNRFYLTGLAHVAREHGVASPVYTTLRDLYRAAILLADSELRVVFSDRFVSVVAATDAVTSAGEAEQAGRGLAIGTTLGAVSNSSSGNSSGVTYNLNDVAAYQVSLWTAVLLAAILLGTIYFMLGMDAEKDPALYAMVMDSSAASSAGAAAGATAR